MNSSPSLEAFEKRLIQAPIINGPRDLLSFALKNSKILGEVLEFGVWTGNSIKHIASLVDSTVWGFDSFEGLPESWDQGPTVVPKGHLKVDIVPTVPPHVRLVVGIFQDTLPVCKSEMGTIRFIHIDSDLYSSAKCILAELNDKIVPGTVILFDELSCFGTNKRYPKWREGEWKALIEWMSDKDRTVSFLARDDEYRAVVVVKE